MAKDPLTLRPGFAFKGSLESRKEITLCIYHKDKKLEDPENKNTKLRPWQSQHVLNIKGPAPLVDAIDAPRSENRTDSALLCLTKEGMLNGYIMTRKRAMPQMDISKHFRESLLSLSYVSCLDLYCTTSGHDLLSVRCLLWNLQL
jgi:hypothetical protein